MHNGTIRSAQEAEYTAVNAALNDVIFSGRFESQPVFSVLDPISKEAVAKLLALDEDDVEAHICSVVGKALSTTGDPYWPMEKRLRVWWGKGNCLRNVNVGAVRHLVLWRQNNPHSRNVTTIELLSIWRKYVRSDRRI